MIGLTREQLIDSLYSNGLIAIANFSFCLVPWQASLKPYLVSTQKNTMQVLNSIALGNCFRISHARSDTSISSSHLACSLNVVASCGVIKLTSFGITS